MHSTSFSTKRNTWSRVMGFEIAVFTSSYTKVPVSETSLAACMARLAVRSPYRRGVSRRSTANNLANKRGYPRRIFVLRIANFEVSFPQILDIAQVLILLLLKFVLYKEISFSSISWIVIPQFITRSKHVSSFVHCYNFIFYWYLFMSRRIKRA